VALECALTDAELDVKRLALAAHGTQTAGLAATIGEETYRTWWGQERFRRPTPMELACCPLPDWVAASPELAGAPA
jgi:hypothetical protein